MHGGLSPGWISYLWFVLLQCTRAKHTHTHINKSAQHFPTLKIDFYFLYTECGGLVCLFVCFVVARARHTHLPKQRLISSSECMSGMSGCWSLLVSVDVFIAMGSISICNVNKEVG